MKLAVVILNWNGRSLLEEFLPSVVEHSGDYHIHIIDNGSTDDSVAYLKTNFPEINLIEFEENMGYTQGYNLGLKKIDAEIFCLLNNDVMVTDSWTKPVIEAFEKDPDLAVVQPKILDYKSQDSFEYAGAAGGYIDKFGFPYCRGRLFQTVEQDLGQFSQTADIHWASGACLFIRKEIFLAENGFEASFFAHMEEVDLCWRIRNKEYKIVYCGDSTIFHRGASTLSHASTRKTYLNFRNSLFMLMRNLPSSFLYGTLFLRLVLDGIAALKFFFEAKPRHSYAIFKAHLDFYRHGSRLIKQRKNLPASPKKYYHKRSIVWAYFVLRKRTFSSL